MHIALEIIPILQRIGQLREGHNIGLEPLLGMLPTGGHLTLRRKVNHICRLKGIEQGDELWHMSVQVHLVKCEMCLLASFVRQEQSTFLRRPADTDDFVLVVVREQIDEIAARERVATYDNDLPLIRQAFFPFFVSWHRYCYGRTIRIVLTTIARWPVRPRM